MSTIDCPKCKTQLPGDLLSGGLVNCYSCDLELQVQAFPALFRKIELGQAGEAVVVATDATCFYHPQKRAAVPCDGCGRFLCGLCDLLFNERHLCPQCLESGSKKGRLKNLQNRRVLYDNIALSAAVFPLLVFYLTCITAPIALYYSIRYWNAPGSLVPRSKVRFVLAGLVASLQITGWLVLLVYLLR